jgi:hypothetical protein
MNFNLLTDQLSELENEQTQPTEQKKSEFPIFLYDCNEDPKGGRSYTIINHMGTTVDRFTAKTETEAVELFQKFREQFNPNRQTFLKHHISSAGTVYLLLEINSIRLNYYNEIEKVHGYIIYVNGESHEVITDRPLSIAFKRFLELIEQDLPPNPNSKIINVK